MCSCVCAGGLGIIPPVGGGGVTLNRPGAGVAECTNSFNSHVCYRHAVIVNVMDDEEQLSGGVLAVPANEASLSRWMKSGNQAEISRQSFTGGVFALLGRSDQPV